jgi:hypothetical protein
MHGVVHVVGTHMQHSVWTECGKQIVRIEGSQHTLDVPDLYKTTEDHPTCLTCIVEEPPWHMYEEVGEAAINPSAITKIRFADEPDPVE